MIRKRVAFSSTLMLLVVFLGIGLPAVAAADAIEVPIDIKPCKDPNVLNVNVIGWLPVAIYEVGDLDDITQVYLEGVPADPDEWQDRGDYLLAKFDAAAVIDTFGVVKDGDVLTLALEGELTDGTPIVGYDDVIILKRGRW